MKHLHLLGLFIILTTLCFTSCDGKERARTPAEDNVANSNLPSTFFIKEHYFPKEYTEHRQDSLLSNGYQVSIKVTTNEDVTVKEIIENTITHKNYYRDFDALIIVKKNDRIVFNQVINKLFIKSNSKITTTFDDEILNSVWLDEFLSTTQNAVEIALSFCEPKSTNCLSYNLIIDERGYTIQPLEKQS